jgi:isopenicillin-N epimerase
LKGLIIEGKKQMPIEKTSTSPDISTTRRSFLKTVGATGAAIAGGSSAVLASSINYDHRKLCNFSELPPKFVYLNNGTEGTMPDCVLSTVEKYLRIWATHPTASFFNDPELGEKQVNNRNKVADFLGLKGENKKDHICLTNNTTMGLSMVLMGLNFKSGEKVVLTDHEHPAMNSPLRVLKERLKIKVQVQKFPSAKAMRNMDSDELLDALFPISGQAKKKLEGAKALCVSHIYYTLGVRLPLDKLRKRADVLKIKYLIVDGAHGLGMMDLTKTGENNIKNCDFYACSGHKWLNGPPGTGFLYMRKRDLSPPDFYPTISHGYKGFDPTSPYSMAELLQLRGCNSVPSYVGMVKAMQFIEDLGGSTTVQKHIMKLSNEVKKFISDKSPNCLLSPYQYPDKKYSELRSGITTFFPWNKSTNCLKDKKNVTYVVDELLKKGLRVRSVSFPIVDVDGQPLQESKKSYAVRVSTGCFNTDSDVEAFKLALEEVLSTIPI